jgi:hypothetical protein
MQNLEVLYGDKNVDYVCNFTEMENTMVAPGKYFSAITDESI